MKRTWVHRLKNRDFINRKADCLECGNNIEIRQVGKAKIWKCILGRRSQSYRGGFYKKEYRMSFSKLEIKKCEKCEMQNQDLRFFDVNHKDGDHDNDRLDNLELLCPNCHRVETLKQWAENKMTKYNRNYKTIN